MNIIKKVSFIIVLNLCMSHVYGVVTRQAEDVFKKWLEWQQIMPDKTISTMTENLDDSFVKVFKKLYEKNITLLSPLTNILNTIAPNNISLHGYCIYPPIDTTLKDNLSMLYDLIDRDMQGFVNLIATTKLMSQEYVVEEAQGQSSHDTIEKYNAFFQLLFAHDNEQIMGQYLFSVANRFYEYCFNEQTFPFFQKMLLDKSYYPLARIMYAVAWSNLAGNGWKHWTEDSLKNLKNKADQGDQIVYIAGGTDIYQMIKSGIYNIKNIDPQLPSQPKYYADGWTFVLRGDGPNAGIGDKIIFNFPDRIITMERTGFELHGTTFKVRIATGDVIELPHSTTTWTFKNAEGENLGNYILERRFCQQADFNDEKNKTMLMSFNELYFVCLPDFLNGWSISPFQFSNNLSIVIKQLRRPVSRQMAVNMRLAALLNSSDFHYIALGTCIN